MTAPANGTTTATNEPTLSATASDNTGGSGLANLQFQYSTNGGSTWNNAGTALTTAPFSFAFATPLAAGAYSARAIATDKAGNTATSPAVSFTVGNAILNVGITAPSGPTNNNKPTLSAIASDTGGTGIASVQFEYSTNGGSAWNNAGAAQTAAPFAYTFTTPLADGSYQVRAVATDKSGNTADSPTASFTIDTVAPTVAMTAPTASSASNHTKPTLAGNASDNTGGSGLANLQFEYSANGGSTWNNAGAAQTTAPFGYTFTTALADGSYQARAVATDNAGNTATSPAVAFTIDTVAPTVAMTAPVNGTTTATNEPTLSATASDNTGGSGLANLQFQYSTNGGSTWNNAGTALTTAPFNFTFTTPLAAGAYSARAIATDKAGNSANSPAVSFSVSNVSITVGITAPSGPTNNNKPTLSAIASETGGTGIASVQFEYSTNGGSAWNNAGAAQNTAPFSYTFTTPLADGSYQARAVATDKSGNTADSSTVSFMIDTVDPTIAMTAPTASSATNHAKPMLAGNASDNTGGSGLANLQFQYSANGGSTWNNAGAAQTTAPFGYTFTTALADGGYQARAVATDNAGNSATSPAVAFTIDTVAPTVAMTAPVNGTTTATNEPTLSATASDNTGGSGLANLQFQYSTNGGTTWNNAGTALTTAPFSFTFATPLAAGAYSARAIATDKAGNSANSPAVSFSVSNASLNVGITAPSGPTNNNKPTLSATASETGGTGIASVQFEYSTNGGTTWNNAGAAQTTAPFSYTFTTPLADGSYRVRAVASDKSGNTAATSTVSFMIDTVDPTIAMTAPTASSATNHAKPMLAGNASDNTGGSGLANLQFQYSANGGSTWNNAGTAQTTAPFGYTFTTALADGSYQARAVATDNAGNTATSPAVAFTIDTVAPTVAMTAPTNGTTTATNEPTLSATASDNTGGSGLANLQFQYSTNGGTTWNNAGTALTTAPFSFTFATPLAAGAYSARAIATDKAGNSANSPAATFSVSNASLNVGITAPSGPTNNNKPTLSATASETGGTGIASVQFEYSTNGGTTWNNAGAAQTTAPFSYTFTTPLADGSYQVRAVASDKSGNTAATSTVSFMIDTVEPTIAMTAPSDGATTSNTTPTLSATASDNTGGSGLATVQFQYTSDRGATWIDAGPAQTSGPFSFTFTTPLADGTYAAVAIATDNAGNQAVSPVVSFTIDTAVSNVLFSDSFDRPYATEDNLGQADDALGGTGTIYYVPIFAGAVIASGALQSNSANAGGVEFSTSSNTGATRGTSVGQDLDIAVDLLVPTDSVGNNTDAGIFFRSRAAFTNDGLLGGTPRDPGGGYWVRLASTGVIQVVDMRNNTVTAFTAQPQSFDATESHTLEVAFHGNDLQVALDDVLQTFNAGGTTVAIPSTGLAGDSTLPGDVSAGNDGCAGLAFGASSGGNSAFGAAAANLIVTSYSSIADLPTDLRTPVSTVNPLPATITSTNFTVSWTGWPGPGADKITSYDVYVSKDGGSFTSFLSHTGQTSAAFTGQPGHSYEFYSVATDNLGNVEPRPTDAEATTTIAGPPTSSVNPLPATTTSTNLTVSWGGSPVRERRASLRTRSSFRWMEDRSD